jgi:tryptophan synthase alpha chain
MASGLATISSDRIAQRFAQLRAAGRCAFVPYVTAGHPDPARSVDLLQGLEGVGADVVELGVPFSDPLADGAVIQASSQRALDHGVRLDQVLEIVSRASLSIPVVLFS